MRVQYPTNVEIIRVPCTGRVDVQHILSAFMNGADGVYVVGCLEGECHFLDGNIRAKKRVQFAKKLLEQIGLEPQRLEMYNLSAAMAQRFVEVAEEMTERVRKLGPNPLNAN